MNSKFTLNIPFECVSHDSSEHPGVEHHFVDHPLISGGGYYGSQSKAKQKFKKEIVTAIETGLRAAKHTELRVIGCKDGTILVVSYRFDSWGYAIAGPGRKYNGGTNGFESYQAAQEYARKHAEQSYGGISWES